MPNISEGASPERRKALGAQSKAIAAARGRRGLSQPQAAAELGVSVETYRSWEHGKRQPPAEVRQRLVEDWGCSSRALAWKGGQCPCCGRPF